MRLKIAPVLSFESCRQQHAVAQAFSPSIISFTGKQTTKDQNVVCQLVVLSRPFMSRKLLRYRTFVGRGQTIKRSCSANLDEGFDKQHVEGLAKRFSLSDDEDIKEDYGKNRWSSSVTSEASGPSPTKNRMDMDLNNSSLPSKFHFLEPMMLGIRPEPPDWPEREAVMWTSIEQKAKSFDLPLSLRMIKKKQQLEGLKDLDLGESASCSVKKAFSSVVFILVELQSCALQMREALCREDLEMIIEKVQRDMHSSFLWLFQQVFSRTPELMVYVMILLANYSVYSTSHIVPIAETDILGSIYEPTAGAISKAETENESTASIFHTGVSRHLMDSSMSTQNLINEFSQVGDQELRDIAEMSLWNSLVDEVAQMQSKLGDVVLDHNATQNFVSPMSVELEPDDYIEYHRTDLLYQMGLSQEPNNPLLLCNYAQFLHLVASDYDRAEFCYKRAVQVEPPDAESLSQYANFLWTIRKDFWGAEERYLQALAAEPNNPYYASKYANFLWSTGGEETCYPLNTSSNENKSINL